MNAAGRFDQQHEFQEHISYDPLSGTFMTREGEPLDVDKYGRIKIVDKRYQARRVAWIMARRNIPEGYTLTDKNNLSWDTRIANICLFRKGYKETWDPEKHSVIPEPKTEITVPVETEVEAESFTDLDQYLAALDRYLNKLLDYYGMEGEPGVEPPKAPNYLQVEEITVLTDYREFMKQVAQADYHELIVEPYNRNRFSNPRTTFVDGQSFCQKRDAGEISHLDVMKTWRRALLRSRRVVLYLEPKTESEDGI